MSTDKKQHRTNLSNPAVAKGAVRNKRRLISLLPSTVEETTLENLSSGRSSSLASVVSCDLLQEEEKNTSGNLEETVTKLES